MPNGRTDIMAQAVFLAQLEAAKNTCKCRTCQILRKASRMMTDQFLQPNPKAPPGVGEVIEQSAPKIDWEVPLEKEE